LNILTVVLFSVVATDSLDFATFFGGGEGLFTKRGVT